MKIHTMKQGSDEWFTIKLGKMSASSAQAIATAGRGLETLCYEKVAEILSGTRQESYSNGDMERGVEQEELAVASYELQTSRSVEKVGFVELDKYTGCSPDGLVGKDGLVEIKCQNNTNYVRTLYTKSPGSKYEWQMQMQMLVTDRKWCDFVVFNENFNDLIIIRIERDEKKAEKLRIGLEKGITRITEILKGVK